jgi:hypothetical protein
MSRTRISTKHRRLLPPSPLFAGLIAAALLAATADARVDSGVKGTVTKGPTLPVCKVGEPCTAPYATTVGIRNLRTKRLKRVRTNSEGRFRARLRPGRYRLRPASGHPFPRCQPATVRVRRHRFKRVSLSCDTAIR